MKNNQRRRIRAVTPVIATMVLIACTLVLATAAGAYTFGLFAANVKQMTGTVSINSGPAAAVNDTATCLGANIAMSITNPGRAANLTDLAINGPDVVNETTFLLAGASSCTVQPLSNWVVGAGASNQTIVVYFGTANVTSGLPYNYVAIFTNGQSISGIEIAD